MLGTKNSRVWDRHIKTYVIGKKTTKEATKNMLWNTDGELALERKKESFFFFLNPCYRRKEREKYHMDAGLAIF